MAWRDFPLTASRWLLLVAVVLSAWLYGGTREWTVDVLRWLLLVVTALFLAGLVLRLRLPRVPWFVVIPSLFLLGQGWFMLWNARRRFVEFAGVFVDVPQPLAGWPGFVDAAMVAPSLGLMTGLLGALWVACDLSANRAWRERLWITLAATGVTIMVLGLAQKFSGAPGIFWDPYRYTGKTFFAVFRYHANAGAFINLVLPLVAGRAVWAFICPGAEKRRIFWTLAALLTAACGFVNVSRAANVICAALLFGLAVWIAASVGRSLGLRRILTTAAVALFALLAAAVLAVSFGMDRTLIRWERGMGNLEDNMRYSAYEVVVRGAWPEAGWWGFGPGTFEPVFNHYRPLVAAALRGRWTYAHSDALQTPMDYGYAGAVAWFVLLAGAMVRAVRGAQRRGRDVSEGEILAACLGFSLAGVMLHSLVDFPLQIPSLQLYVMLMAGLACGLCPGKKNADHPVRIDQRAVS
jgi:hypothetical protein